MLSLFTSKKLKMESRCSPEIGNIKGQSDAKLALLIAAVGRHNLLLIGPPGEGKTQIASTITGYLPPISDSERLQLNNIYNGYRYSTRPFVEVSPSTTISSLLGGGLRPTIGMVTLAHAGVLFIDELSEQKRQLIDALRQCMESKTIQISRAGVTKTYRADFQLIAATNPCYCGFDGFGTCTCTTAQLSRYKNMISGPIADRIDLTCNVHPLESTALFGEVKPNQSQEFAQIVRNTQVFREISRGQRCYNSQIPSHECLDLSSRIIVWEVKAVNRLKALADSGIFSTRKMVKLIRVCRSVADIHCHPAISLLHLNTALTYVNGDHT